MVPFDFNIDRRCRNVWDIFFDWQGETLPEIAQSEGRRLRESRDLVFDTRDPEIVPCIVIDRDSDSYRNPHIEYISNSDPDYATYFCTAVMAQAQDAGLGQRLIRVALYNEQQRVKSPEKMMVIFQSLYRGLWIADLEFAANGC